MGKQGTLNRNQKVLKLPGIALSDKTRLHFLAVFPWRYFLCVSFHSHVVRVYEMEVVWYTSVSMVFFDLTLFIFPEY